jgi:ABC-type multidrug transport system permease subunit
MTSDTRDPIAVLQAPDAGFLADQLVRRLESLDYRVVRVTTAQAADRYTTRLAIPPGFTQSVLDGKPVHVTLTRTGQNLGADYDQVRLSRAVYTTLGDLILVASSGRPVTAEALEAQAKQPRLLTMKVASAGNRTYVPSGFEQSVPGTMVMFCLLVLFTTGGVSLVVERNQGILRRLASAPMSRSAVVLAKWASRMFLGVIQIAFAMLAGTVLFHLRWGPHLPAIAMVLVAYAALAATLGLLVGNFGRTEGQVIGIGVISTNVLAALGGCWWPVEITPRWAQTLAIFLPTGWVMDALHKLISFGASPATVIPHIAAITAAALVAGWIVARSFRFQ